DQPLASNYISKLQSIASLHSISVVFGTLVKAGQRAYNAVIWLEGDQLFRYNKTHVHWTENFIPGDDFPVFESELTKAGALSCFDLGFPEASRSLVLKGAEIIVAPSLVPADFKDINKKRVVARALDNQIFVIYCNYAGGGHSGGSLIADPGGDILMEADDKPGIFIKNIDLNRIGQWRKKELLFQNRRPEIYKIW
ncbi:MAG: carbon-nitrogen hydrolase family protein, partial [Nitrospinota bacterium]